MPTIDVPEGTLLFIAEASAEVTKAADIQPQDVE